MAKSEDNDFIRHFTESLISNLSEEGSVIVYNKSFESARNNEIGQMYPEFKDDLERINRNMIDFMESFKQKNYYTKEMQGSHSLKQVLPALFPDNSELDYSNLALVHEAQEASDTFSTLKEETPQKQEAIRRGLLDYCKLDTYAMVKIYEKFKEAIE